MTGATRLLAEHLAGLSSAPLPEAALTAAARSLLDATGVMLAATTLGEDSAAFADLAGMSPGPCTVIGRPLRASPLAAALANGALAHGVDFEDALDGAPVHPNAAVIPAALAIAELLGEVSGDQLLTAIAAGSDIVCRMGLALEVNPDAHGWYPPPILSAYGAAASAGVLLRLKPEGLANALSLALAQGGFSAEFKTHPNSSLRGVRDAFPAHAGVLSALLAARGVRGHDAALEGKAGFFALFARGAWSPTRLLEGLGERYLGADVAFKPWPSCRGTHAFIEAALDLQSKIPSLAMVEELIARGPALVRMLDEPHDQKRAPRTAIDARFSLPFCIAAALIEGRIGLDSFSAEQRGREDIRALAAKVRFEADEALGMPHAASGWLAVRLKDGRILERGVAQALGGLASAMTDEDLVGKFLACAAHAPETLAPARARDMAGRLLGMRGEACAGDVFRILAN